MLQPNISPRTIETNRNNKNSRSQDKKIWPLFSNFSVPERNEKRSEIICPMQIQLARPRAIKGTLLGPREVNNSWRDGNPDINDQESFHRAISPILAVAQIFALLPVLNIRNPSPAKLCFKRISIRTFYTTAVIVMLFFMTYTAFIHMITTLRAETFVQDGGIATATGGIMFYGNSLMGTVLFFRLAPKWIALQREWRMMERFFNSCKYPQVRLRWKFMLITAMIMIPAALEHTLSVVKAIPDSSEFPYNNGTWREYVEIYTDRSHAFTYTTVKFSTALGIFYFIISKIATFTWNFTDLFVILVSTGLAERYKHLNQVVLTGGKSDCSNLDWRQLREQYAALSSLVKHADNVVSPIILLSFTNNLYFICLQLLNGLSPKGTSIIMTLYFFASFAFLIGRTVSVTLLTARINDQSKLALPAIYSCPASCFTNETQRLQLQLTSDEVVMTGLKFFSITRNFMLAVAGAILTYEVVLLQFNVAMAK
ncbi:gustatory receptor for sugar taste 64e [Diachasma alloeum]|uniref:Gustatory receptor 2 n=1 Tax=Diachasma alloeum TaxID=454923 RepID=A0A4E0RJX7_9HYME|nr:gustatory receptor for sugar taste 64e [Diachasma alloeum]THK33052.1 gustatory receptor 2 [Diachasma alloeum]